ncbi:MAG: hypothetical protein R6V77_00580 [Candidatus Cloacimonadaceae bacterium]
MLKIDRMQFPNKYPVPNWIKLLAIALVLMGIFIHNCTQDLQDKEISISDVSIAAYSKVHVEVTYTLQNLAKADREVWLLLKVYDDKDEELGSVLYLVTIKAGVTQSRIKLVDKLERPLADNEQPAKATIQIYKRKVLS